MNKKQSNLYITALYIAVTRYITVTGTCILAVTLYIIYTLPFPKGDRYIQVSLHFHISDFALGLALKQRLDATRK